MTRRPVLTRPSNPHRSRLRDFGPVAPGLPLPTVLRAATGAGLALAITGAFLWLINGSGAMIDHPMIIAPFAATCVLIFTFPNSTLARPYAVVLGNCIAAFCGLTALLLVPHPLFGVALAEFLAICLMALARSIHPPAGGVAVYVVLASPPGAAPDWSFLITTALPGSVLLVSCAVLWHRLAGQDYPPRSPN